jgi:glutaredoxin
MTNLARIILYGAEFCRFCQQAKTLLEKSKVNFTYIDVENEESQQQLNIIQKKYGYSKIPMVFIDKEFIGGYTELYKLVDTKQINLD